MPLPPRRLRSLALSLPAVATLGIQIRWALGASGFEGLRLALLLAATLATGLALALTLRGSSRPMPWTALALVAPPTLWATVLEHLLRTSKPVALPLMVTGSAMLVHAAFALFLVRDASGDTGLQRGLRKALVVSASIALPMTASEFVLLRLHPLNLYAPQADDPSSGPCMVLDASGRSRAVPGFRGQFMHHEFPGIRVEINELGLRDDAREADPPDAETLSILVLGDSFVFGVGVEHREALDERLEQRSTEFTDRPVLAYNAGIPGYGTIHERLRLAELEDRVRPDVVLLGFYEGNDLDDNWTGEALWDDLEDARQHQQMKASLIRRSREQARRRRNLGAYLGDALGVPFWERRSALAQQTRIIRRLTDLGVLPPDPRVNDLMNLCLLRRPPPLVEELRDASIRQVIEIARETERIGARLIVFLIPAQVQVDEVRFHAFATSQRAREPEEFSRTAFHRDLLERLQAEGIDVVDTLPSLEAETRRGLSCYHPEGHWNARGHELATDLLIGALKANPLDSRAGRQR